MCLNMVLNRKYNYIPFRENAFDFRPNEMSDSQFLLLAVHILLSSYNNITSLQNISEVAITLTYCSLACSVYYTGSPKKNS